MEKITYEVLENGYVLRSDGWFIPVDPANSDYQRYLNPEAQQSTPSLPA